MDCGNPTRPCRPDAILECRDDGGWAWTDLNQGRVAAWGSLNPAPTVAVTPGAIVLLGSKVPPDRYALCLPTPMVLARLQSRSALAMRLPSCHPSDRPSRLVDPNVSLRRVAGS